MFRRLRLTLVSLVAVSALSACGDQQVPKKQLDDEPPLTPSPSYTFGNMPYNFRYEQSFHRDYDVLQHVRVERGSPVLTVRNLPEGATFDGRTLSWTPPCGKDPGFYLDGLGTHVIMFTLKSDDGTDHFIERDAGMVVNEFNDYGGERPCEEQNQ